MKKSSKKDYELLLDDKTVTDVALINVPPRHQGDRGVVSDDAADADIEAGERRAIRVHQRIAEAKASAKLRLLSRDEVVARIGLSYPSIWKLMNQGVFPRARQISPERVGWVSQEIDDWIKGLPIRPLSEREHEEAAAE